MILAIHRPSITAGTTLRKMTTAAPTEFSLKLPDTSTTVPIDRDVSAVAQMASLGSSNDQMCG